MTTVETRKIHPLSTLLSILVISVSRRLSMASFATLFAVPATSDPTLAEVPTELPTIFIPVQVISPATLRAMLALSAANFLHNGVRVRCHLVNYPGNIRRNL
ncbi:hypothetical protein B0J13DRAFT_575335 [Dactylonectria estremocensis]|uniref:Uncharacterized protein n=1 Tax=Dactylonectria estremocensis TaxID=1079267 RepID=A0A9P9IAT1_9HYPO|nr:hypothetical protein B0J13DRAFT_575335 [Dactylonectria estremocensis]